MSDGNVRIVARHRGPPTVLRAVEEPVPLPGAGQVLVRVRAAGVAWADVMMREGIYPGTAFPLTPGYDIVGVVEHRGDGANAFEIGDTVAALTERGGYARFVVLDERELVRVPAGLDASRAVSLVLNYVTAYQMLHRCANVAAGGTILVHGAGGGVGTALLELARNAGVHAIGTASAGKGDLVRSLGATHVDYRSEDFVARTKAICGGAGADAAFDAIGGDYFRRSYAALRPTGTLVGYGISSLLANGRFRIDRGIGYVIAGARFRIDRMMTDGKRVAGYAIVPWKTNRAEAFASDLSALFAMLAAGDVDPVVSERIPLREASRAHELLGGAKVTGKITLV